MIWEPSLKLIDVTLKSSSSIVCSYMGDFTGTHNGAAQEILLIKTGGLIELYAIDVVGSDSSTRTTEDADDEEQVISLRLMARLETRSILRQAVPIRLTGSKRDAVGIVSDSGALSVIDFSASDIASGNSTTASVVLTPKLLHCPTYGNTGCRRGTPGQYLAVDPKGRALLVAAVEKRKLIYVLNRDSTNQSVMASPLEAHRPRTITWAVVGVDNGYENPIFASLETQYPEYIPPSSPLEVLESTADDDEDVDDVANIDDRDEGDTAIPEGAGGQWARMVRDMKQVPDRQVSYYELDLGLNHVTRKWATTVSPTATCLAAVPGGGDGPGGVLVGSEDFIEYVHDTRSSSSSATSKDLGRMIVAIPRRKLHPSNKGILIQSIVVQRQKRYKFFALAQSELGDLYKLTLQLDPENKDIVTGMTITVLDTIPVASSLNISKFGMLFCAAEFGNSTLYQFERIDVEEDEHAVVCTSETTLDQALKEGMYTTSLAVSAAPTFEPGYLKNLLPLAKLESCSLSPALNILVGELVGTEMSPQLYIPCGRGSQSSLQVLRHGIAVNELAVSDLPGTPGAIFTIGGGSKQEDRYIVISFADATLFLEISANGVEEVADAAAAGFITNAPTLACGTLGHHQVMGTSSSTFGIVQVHPEGVRHIHQGRANEWRCAGLKKFEHGCVNQFQILVSYRFSGEVIYFELEEASGNLVEVATVDVGDGSEITCVDLDNVPRGRTRCLFAAVGCRDGTVRILSLVPAGTGSRGGGILSQKSMTSCPTRPHSVCLVSTPDASEMILRIGLEDGTALRFDVDPITGQILSSGAPSKRLLGARPVRVIRSKLQGKACTLLLSSRPWISMGAGREGRQGGVDAMTAPLSYAPLDHAHPINSAAIGGEGIIATVGNTMRILSVDAASASSAVNSSNMSKDGVFHSNSIELRYTPRQQCLVGGRYLAIVEADILEYGYEEKKSMGFDPETAGKKVKQVTTKKEDEDAMDMDMDDDEQQEKKKESERNEEDEEDADNANVRATPIRGPVPPTGTSWSSCIRIIDPITATTLSSPIELEKNEAALCCCNVHFLSRGNESLLAIGSVTNFNVGSQSFSAAHISLYRMVGERLQLLHKTKAEAPVTAVAAFQGRLLAAVGRTLRLYEMGKKQLLRKCELRSVFPTMIKTLNCASERVFVGDLMQGMYVLKYHTASNKFVVLAKDLAPRCITSVELLDFHTVAVGDKLGNLVVLRIPKGAGSSGVDAAQASRALWDTSLDARAPKLEVLCNYYIGEIITGMTRASLVTGGAEALLYVTITGRIGALSPIQSREAVDFLERLEQNIRLTYKEVPRWTGRDPLAYRSYYSPVKHVVDGSLCESYETLPLDVQKKIAEELDRTVVEVKKKMEDIRNLLL
jgi:splicing factor 3B subunit 3